MLLVEKWHVEQTNWYLSLLLFTKHRVIWGIVCFDFPFHAYGDSTKTLHPVPPVDMVGTLDPHRKLYWYMDSDDVGWPSLSLFGWETKPMWAYLIVYFIYLELFMLNSLIWWAELNS